MAEEKSSSKFILDDEIVYSRQEIVWPFMRQCTVAMYIKYIQKLLIKSKKLSLALARRQRLSVVCKILQRRRRKSLRRIRVVLVIIQPGMLLNFIMVVPLVHLTPTRIVQEVAVPVLCFLMRQRFVLTN